MGLDLTVKKGRRERKGDWREREIETRRNTPRFVQWKVVLKRLVGMVREWQERDKED